MTALAPGRVVDLAGRRLAYTEYGEPGGRPLLYCHGMPGSRYELAWGAHVAANRGWRLIVPERPGYGGSERSDGYGFAGWVDDVAALIAVLSVPRLDVLGYSAGGAFALAVAQGLPECVRHLMLVSSIAPFDTPGCFDGMAPANREMLQLARSDLDALAAEYAPLAGNSTLLADAFTEALPAADQRVLADHAHLRTIFQTNFATALQQGLTGMLSDLACVTRPWGFTLDNVVSPVTLWHGTADINVPPAMSQALSQQLPRHNLRLVDAAGHLLLCTHWDTILAEMQD